MAVLVGESAAAFDPLADLEATFRPRSTLDSRIRDHFRRGEGGRFVGRGDWAIIHHFYAERDYQALWLKDAKSKAAAQAVVARLAHASEAGLDSKDLTPYVEHLKSGVSDDKQQAMFEVMLTEAIMLHARALHSGQFDPKRVDREWLMKPRLFSAALFLKKLADGVDPVVLLAGMEPSVRDYRGLKKALARYRKIAERGGWSSLPEDLPTLRPGMSSSSVPKLRRRIAAELDFDSFESEDSSRYDERLVDAVKSFQLRNGLKVDGIVGKGTREILNIPVGARIRSILSSLERWRWMPRELGTRYLMVNLPAFNLELIEQGRKVWQTRVITGRKERPSPSITSNITQLKVNPKWHVPDSLAIKDLVPKQLKNPRYLRNSGYRIFDRESQEEIDPASINWASYRDSKRFPYLIRQESGDRNALGRLKFVMPSKHAIYLHDTPSKRLFDKDERMFSSGCIRVDSPYDLAGMLLDRTDAGQGTRRVLSAIEQGDTKSIALPDKVPVYLGYFTAWVDEQGITHFRRDVYGRDQLFTDSSVVAN